jgi:methionine biosynthesis protein MetW
MTAPKYHLESIFDPQWAHPDDAHSVLMRLIPPNSRILELGCASGYLSGYMEQKLGCRVTGLEADAAAVEIAKSRCSEVFQVDLDSEDALQVARSSAPYDVLLATAVLEHLKYPERLLHQARELLNPNAKIIVSLPNIAHWSIRLNLLRGKFEYQDYGIMDRTHLHFYTLSTGRQLLEESGLQVESTFIAGSGLQNLLNTFSRKLNRPIPRFILPAFFAYEFIMVATMHG